MKISSNIVAMMTITNMNKANNSASNAMQRLSSGCKINSAKDDAAGLAIANKLDLQVRAIDQANRNAMDGISMIQTGEGALNEIHAILNKMKTLSVQASTGSLQDEDRAKIKQEVDQLILEMKNISERTDFNGIKLLDSDENIMIQTGANAYENLKIDCSDINMKKVFDELGLNFKDSDLSNDELKLDTKADWEQLITKVDNAIDMTSNLRGVFGASQNRLESIVENLGVNGENMTASLSRIYDADMAEEMTEYTQQNVITQAGISMLAQANQRPSQVLQLLNS